MTVSKKDIQFLLAFIGIAAVAIVYFLYFKPTTENTEQLVNENRELSAEVASLEDLASKKEFYLEETERYKTEIANIYEKFPANVYPEDVIQELIDLQNGTGIEVPSFTFGGATQIYSPIAESVEQMAEADARMSDGDYDDEAMDAIETVTLAGMAQPVSMSFNCDLGQFMSLAQFIGSRPTRDVIENVSLTYDSSTGLLSGGLSMQKYFVTGLSKPYNPATFGSVILGTDNIFSTIRMSDVVEAEGENPDAETEGGEGQSEGEAQATNE